jgi:alkanesulfonate monooxygenase SsuD/methylene tetrahydromethanopterin reductase-like flavin-dependent oxidoreductase (luciferase family)
MRGAQPDAPTRESPWWGVWGGAARGAPAPGWWEEWEPDPSARTDPLQRARVSFVGSPSTVAREMRDFVERTRADELIVVAHIYDHAARLRSYEIAAALMTG